MSNCGYLWKKLPPDFLRRQFFDCSIATATGIETAVADDVNVFIVRSIFANVMYMQLYFFKKLDLSN